MGVEPNSDSYSSFVQTEPFTARWLGYKLTDSDMRLLESLLIENPRRGVVIAGAGGLRKMRFARVGQGKSGGFRIGYTVFPEVSIIVLIAIYTHADQDNFTPQQKVFIAKLILEIQSLFKGRTT